MKRQIILGLLFTGLCFSSVGSLGNLHSNQLCAQATSPEDIPEFRAKFKRILEVELRAKTPGEFAFIKKVIARLEANTLPFQLVMETFQWARQKPEHQAQYFIFALRKRAAEKGIQI